MATPGPTEHKRWGRRLAMLFIPCRSQKWCETDFPALWWWYLELRERVCVCDEDFIGQHPSWSCEMSPAAVTLGPQIIYQAACGGTARNEYRVLLPSRRLNTSFPPASGFVQDAITCWNFPRQDSILIHCLFQPPENWTADTLSEVWDFLWFKCIYSPTNIKYGTGKQKERERRVVCFYVKRLFKLFLPFLIRYI